MDAAREAIFERVGDLIDRAPSLADVEFHRLHLIAARRWRAQGRAVPESIVADERLAAAQTLAAPLVLERVRAAATGPVLLVKGPDVARHYPEPSMRAARDLDIVVPDAEATQAELLSAGFVEVGDPELYEDIHHLRPLAWGPLPVVVEVHHSLKWVDRLAAPSAEELLGLATPTRLEVPGVLTLPPAHHALVLAAHAWAHRPLGRLRDLLDIALVARLASHDDLSDIAARWGLSGVWGTTARAIDAVLGSGGRTVSLSFWARHLGAAREQTVLEAHLQGWMAGLWGLPGAQAVAAATAELRADLWRDPDELWPAKAARVKAAVSHAFTRKSDHDRTLATAPSKGDR
jgi:Uncharacterised nucleotidyltransferase